MARGGDGGSPISNSVVTPGPGVDCELDRSELRSPDITFQGSIHYTRSKRADPLRAFESVLDHKGL